MKTIVYTLSMLLCASWLTAQQPAPASAPQRVSPTDGPYEWTHGPLQYDPSGNITAIGSDAYTYDAMGRLTSASVHRPDQPGSQTYDYTYDVYGNRLTYAINPATNRLTALGAQYDTAGNMTQWQPAGSAATRTYTYDALNMITKVEAGSQTVTYVYTADDERLWQFNTTTNISHWTLRDLSGKVLRDFLDDGSDTDPAWVLYREYIYRDGTLLAIKRDGVTDHVSVDHLGTPRLMTDANRRKVFHHHYLPFGEQWTVNDDPVDGSKLRFTGHERDDDPLAQTEGTLDYMHARYYAPDAGRFLSVDPLILTHGQQPQSWNRYSYVRNRPSIFRDSTGLFDFCFGIGMCFETITVAAADPFRSAQEEADRDSQFRDAELLRDAQTAMEAGKNFALGSRSYFASLGYGVFHTIRFQGGLGFGEKDLSTRELIWLGIAAGKCGNSEACRSAALTYVINHIDGNKARIAGRMATGLVVSKTLNAIAPGLGLVVSVNSMTGNARQIAATGHTVDPGFVMWSTITGYLEAQSHGAKP